MSDNDSGGEDAPTLFYDSPVYRGPCYNREAPLPHEDADERWQRAVYEHMFRELLSNIDHQDGDYHLNHLGILRRLHAVIGRKIAELEGALDA